MITDISLRNRKPNRGMPKKNTLKNPPIRQGVMTSEKVADPVAGAGDKPTVLRVYLNDLMLAKRLKSTKTYSKNTIKNKMLFNCANLVAVILGLIGNVEKYLRICLDRDRITQFHELDLLIYEATKKAGIQYLGEEYSGIGEGFESKNTHLKMLPLSSTDTLVKQLTKVGESLPKDYATPIGIIWTNNVVHIAMLRRNGMKKLEFIDPQKVGESGSYPLRFPVREDTDVKPYKSSIKSIFYIEGPSIDANHLAIAKSDIANIIMEEEPVYFQENTKPVLPVKDTAPVAYTKTKAKAVNESNESINTRNALLEDINKLQDNPLKLMDVLRKTELPEETIRSIFKSIQAQTEPMTRKELNSILSRPLTKENSLVIRTYKGGTKGTTRRRRRNYSGLNSMRRKTIRGSCLYK